jgi:hypothetical protein
MHTYIHWDRSIGREPELGQLVAHTLKSLRSIRTLSYRHNSNPDGPTIHIDANLDMLPQPTEILGEIIHEIEFLQKLLERAPFSR